MKINLKRYKLPATIVAIFCCGIALGYFTHTNNKSTEKTECATKKYDLLDPTSNCDSFNEKIQRVKDLEFNVTKLINEKIKKNEVTQVSVFYRDLDSRRWFGINADEDFYPASLLKLPEAIAYFKYAEAYPAILNRKVKIPEDQKDKNSGQYFKFGSNLVPGKEYTIQSLIEDLLVYSDNNAIDALNKNLPSDFSYNVFRDIGLPEPVIYNEKSNWSISVRMYGGILRTLYLSTYLNPQYSEQILNYLSQSKFNEGIRSVVAKDTPVAHKFGEAALLNPDGSIATRVLHDCGIVYNKDNPYIICIMTKGMDIPMMTRTIRDIADLVQKENDQTRIDPEKNIYLKNDD